MVTKEYTYQKAFEMKKQILAEKKAEHQRLLNAAYISNPKLHEIDTKLSSIGAQLAITALSGNSEKLENLKKISLALSEEKKAILKKAQIFDIVYDCPVCEDSGYIGGKICECVKKLANSIMIEELTREMPLDNCRFDNFDLKYYSEIGEKQGENPHRRMTAIFNLCKDYAENFDPEKSENLLFMGQTGLGKTHLTLAIVGKVIEKGYLSVYGPCENLFSLIESEKFTGENKGSYETMLNCDLLVLDDLGAENATSFTKSALYNLINTRLLSKKPTIINTNLSMKEIEMRYTQRVSSRLIGNYNANMFLGKDIRQQKIAEK